jgi:uncharacterized protein (DUF952 family)
MTALLHIAPTERWQRADADYVDPSLDTEGFIHCSTTEQVLTPANERFAGRTDLVLLVIDPALVDAKIVFEDCYETGTKFPHIYGPLPTVAVVQVVAFPPNDDGTFSLPTELTSP